MRRYSSTASMTNNSSRSIVGPIVASDEARSAEFEVSLLERLFERPLYAQYAQQNGAQNRSSKRLPPFISLVKVCIGPGLALCSVLRVLTDFLATELS